MHMVIFYTSRQAENQVITIGEENCDNSKYYELCNGPLHPDKEYWLVYTMRPGHQMCKRLGSLKSFM